VCRDPDAGEIICILDALDECAVSHRRLLATRFAGFCATNDLSVKFRVLITSRLDSALRAAFDRGSKSGAIVSRLNGESENEVAVITKEINLLIDEEIKRFKETREESMINDDMHHILRRES
jgi:ankyrin repeat domain-containing protein 50